MAIEVLTKVYKPSMTVGQVYAKVYGSVGEPKPIGNVLELSLEQDEDVIEQDDMTVLGGGSHAEVRRVKKVKIKMKLADLNVINLARSVLGSVSGVEAGDATDEPFAISSLGVLLPLMHIAPTDVVVKKGTDALTATPVPEAGNYVVRPEGIFILDSAAGIAKSDKLWIS